MKKATVLGLMALLLAFGIQAQKSQGVHHFELEVEGRGSAFVEQMIPIKGGYLLIKAVHKGRFRGTNYFIERLSKQRKLIYSTKIDQKIDEGDTKIKGLYSVAGKPILVTCSDKEAKLTSFKVRAYLIDTKDGTLGNAITLHTHKFRKNRYQPVFHVSMSPDQKHMLFGFVSPLGDRQKRKGWFAIYNSQLKEVWSKNFENMVVKKQTCYEVLDAKMDNDKNVYFLMQYRSGLKKRDFKFGTGSDSYYGISRRGKLEYVEVVKVNKNGNQSQKIEAFESKKVKRLALFIQPDGAPFLCGYYTTKDKSCSTGAISIRLDKKLRRLPTVSTQEICVQDRESLKDRITQKARDKHTNSTRDINPFIREFVAHENGGFSMIGEGYSKYVTRTRMGDHTQTTWHKEYENLYITRFDSKGKIIKTNNIYKFLPLISSSREQGLDSKPWIALSQGNTLIIVRTGKKYELQRKSAKQVKRKQKKGKKGDIVFCHKIDVKCNMKVQQIIDFESPQYKQVSVNIFGGFFVLGSELVISQYLDKKKLSRLEFRNKF